MNLLPFDMCLLNDISMSLHVQTSVCRETIVAPRHVGHSRISIPLSLCLDQVFDQLDVLLGYLLSHQIGDIDVRILLLGQQIQHQLAVLSDSITILSRICPGFP